MQNFWLRGLELDTVSQCQGRSACRTPRRLARPHSDHQVRHIGSASSHSIDNRRWHIWELPAPCGIEFPEADIKTTMPPNSGLPRGLPSLPPNLASTPPLLQPRILLRSSITKGRSCGEKPQERPNAAKDANKRRRLVKSII